LQSFGIKMLGLRLESLGEIAKPHQLPAIAFVRAASRAVSSITPR
jgi:hypothetical protein